MPYLVPPEEITPGVPVHYASTCSACPAACGLMVSVRDGRPVKLEGHPDHPLSQGGLCAIGQADVRALYDAGRLQGPTLGGQAATWAELDAHVLARLGRGARGGGRGSVLSPTLSGPTARRAPLARFSPRMAACSSSTTPAPASSSALLEAYELLTGRRSRRRSTSRQADLLVVLGSRSARRPARSPSRTRRPGRPAGARGERAGAPASCRSRARSPSPARPPTSGGAPRRPSARLAALWLLRHGG